MRKQIENSTKTDSKFMNISLSVLFHNKYMQEKLPPKYTVSKLKCIFLHFTFPPGHPMQISKATKIQGVTVRRRITKRTINNEFKEKR